MRTRAIVVGAMLPLLWTTLASGQVEIKSGMVAPRVSSMREEPPLVAIDWDEVIASSALNATTQIGGAGTGPLQGKIYGALHDFDAQYPRWQLWGGGAKDPTLGVAEKVAPSNGVSRWDFSQIDPSFERFLESTAGHDAVVNLEMTPDWMYAPNPSIDNDPRGPIARVFTIRKLLVTPREFGEYYARVLSWWEKGGFTDEFGQWHSSGHHFKIPYWEVLNERNHAGMTAEEYTALYDATVEAIKAVDPDIKFVGLALAHPWAYPRYFTYFLNPKNHKPGVSLDVISYHFYAKYGPADPPAAQVATTFDQATAFIDNIKYINAIRDLLSPRTRVMINELGTIIGTEAPQVPWPPERLADVAFHLRISAAMYAYLYGNMAELGVESAGQSSMGIAGGHVGAYSALSMLNAGTAAPNIRYKVAKLLMAEFPPGSKIVNSYTGIGVWRNPFPVYVQPYVTPDGMRKVLIVNKMDERNDAVIPGAKGGRIRYLGGDLGEAGYRDRVANSDEIELGGLEVAILTIGAH